ncbi:MAG: hypothetical protein GVY07_04725 [Bacteroidetes bacterium]|nr:hypothetical protein [Bacteroidota bacterium]
MDLLASFILLQYVLHLGAHADDHVDLGEENSPQKKFIILICFSRIGNGISATFSQFGLVFQYVIQ